MHSEERLNAFVDFGKALKILSGDSSPAAKKEHLISERFKKKFDVAIVRAELENPWFTQDFIMKRMAGIADMLTPDKLHAWLASYPVFHSGNAKDPKRIGVINAGNVPLVGFHDFLSVLISGHIFVGKLSSKDTVLFELVRDLLIYLHKPFHDYIIFEEGFLKDFDAVIATGSNNSSRYFEYYFGQYPHIIRRNRNAIAVLDGSETEAQLTALGNDIFLFFGLGCRNVSKLYVPEGYSFQTFFESVQHFQELYYHNKYANNYDYHRAIFLLNKTPHLDNGFLLVREDDSLASPIAVLHYNHYKSKDGLKKDIEIKNNEIQCMVSGTQNLPGSIPFGKSQEPELWDYADDIDTLKFLESLS